MNVSDGFNSALVGIRTGMQDMQNHARHIANNTIADSSVSGGDASPSLAESLVGLKESQLQVEASIKVIKTLDEVLGTLLDVDV